MLRPRRVIASGAVALLASAVLARPAAQAGSGAAIATAAPTITAWDFFSADSLARGLFVDVEVQNLLPVNQVVGLASGSAEAHFAVGRSTSLAVLPDPGDLVRSAPGLVAGLGNIPNLPEYPAQASASFPAAPTGSFTLLPNVGLAGGQLSAAATDKKATASAGLGSFISPAGGVPGFRVAGVNTAATSEQTSAAGYQAAASNTVNDVDLLGGLLHIGQISSSATAAVDDTGKFTAPVATVEVAGATLAGTPVRITDKGLVAASSATALAPVIGALAAPLNAAGISVKLTPAVRNFAGNAVTVTSGSVEIDAQTSVDGYPGVVSIQLGASQASVAAANPETAAGPPVPGPPGEQAATIGPTLSAPVSGTVPGPLASAAPTSPAVGAAPTPLATSTGNPIVHALKRIDFRPVYPWLLLSGLALLAGRRLAGWWLARRRSPTSDLKPIWRW
jgi:hypothetical protein